MLFLKQRTMKKIIIWLFLTSINYSTTVSAQSKYFEKSLGWEYIQNGQAIFEKTDGNYIVLGDATVGNNGYWWHIFNLEVSNEGICPEEPEFYESPENYGGAIFDGIPTEYGFAALGYMVGPFATDDRPYLLKINHEGEFLDSTWVDFCDNCSAYTLCRTPDGGYMLGGSVRQYSGNNFTTYPYLIRLNEQGEVMWDRAYTQNNGVNFGSDYSRFRSIVTDSISDTYYVLGIKGYNPSVDVIWMHIDSSGNILSQNILGDEQFNTNQQATKMIRTSDGGWLINYFIIESGNSVSGRLLKLNATGDTIEWQKEIFYWGEVSVLQELPDGSFIVGGEASPLPDYAFNATIAHVSANGDSIYWQRSYGGAGDDDYIYDFTPTSDGGYFFVGRTETNVPNGYANVYLLKTNCMGLLTEPQAQYSYTNPEGNTIAFQNLSQFVYPDSLDGGHYSWDFGDGFNSNEQNPTHTYAQAGVYLAKLTAVVCQDTSLMYQSICIGTSAHPAPSFTHSLQNDTLVSFTNTSSNAQNAVFVWDFGDGTPPTQTITQQTQQHSYSQAGEHQVTLSVIMCLDTTVYTQVVNTYAVGMQVLPLEGGLEGGLWAVLPNPAQDYLVISSQTSATNATFVLYDVLGREVLRQHLSSNNTILTEHLPAGVYLYQIINPQNQTLQHGKLSILH
jgi:PKD repeat protein